MFNGSDGSGCFNGQSGRVSYTEGSADIYTNPLQVSCSYTALITPNCFWQQFLCEPFMPKKRAFSVRRDVPTHTCAKCTKTRAPVLLYWLQKWYQRACRCPSSSKKSSTSNFELLATHLESPMQTWFTLLFLLQLSKHRVVSANKYWVDHQPILWPGAGGILFQGFLLSRWSKVSLVTADKILQWHLGNLGQPHCKTNGWQSSYISFCVQPLIKVDCFALMECKLLTEWNLCPWVIYHTQEDHRSKLDSFHWSKHEHASLRVFQDLTVQRLWYPNLHLSSINQWECNSW